MYQYKKQEKRYNKRQSPQIMKVPQLKTKAYSFTDPLFQSFGNYNPQSVKNLQKKSENYRIERFEVQQSRIQSQLFSQLQEVSDRITLMSRMLKINKVITNPSVLMVNSQNKIKTEMLIETKRLNNDENSIILCENANKYLTFLQVLDEQQNLYQIGTTFQENYRNDIKINLQSRNRNFRQIEKRQKEGKKQAYQQLKLSDLEQLKHESSRGKTSRFQGDSNQFFSHDNSSHINSNPKTTNFTSGLSTAQKMFQGIKTPQNNQNQRPLIFTPLRQQNKYQQQFANLQTEGKKTKNVKSPQSSAVLQVKKEIKKSQQHDIHTFNKKVHQTKSKSPLMNPKVQKIQIQRSKSKNQKSKQNLIQQKKVSSKDLKGKNKTRSFSNFQSMIDSKNLAFKTLDKTNQFDKMLKMASSRMNPV